MSGAANLPTTPWGRAAGRDTMTVRPANCPDAEEAAQTTGAVIEVDFGRIRLQRALAKLQDSNRRAGDASRQLKSSVEQLSKSFEQLRAQCNNAKLAWEAIDVDRLNRASARLRATADELGRVLESLGYTEPAADGDVAG